MDSDLNLSDARELMVLCGLLILLSSILTLIFFGAQIEAAALSDQTAIFVVESTLFFCEIVLR